MTTIFARRAALGALFLAAGARGRSPGFASARWNEIARTLVVKYRPNNPAAFRVFAYLGLAQHDAVVVAEGRDRGSVPGAVAGASAAVLAYALPAEAQALDSIVRVQQQIAASADPSPAGPAASFVAGTATGRQIGEGIVARARSDRFDAPYTGQIPGGPGN
jgi:hypothetical protein